MVTEVVAIRLACARFNPAYKPCALFRLFASETTLTHGSHSTITFICCSKTDRIVFVPMDGFSADPQSRNVKSAMSRAGCSRLLPLPALRITFLSLTNTRCTDRHRHRRDQAVLLRLVRLLTLTSRLLTADPPSPRSYVKAHESGVSCPPPSRGVDWPSDVRPQRSTTPSLSTSRTSRPTSSSRSCSTSRLHTRARRKLSRSPHLCGTHRAVRPPTCSSEAELTCEGGQSARACRSSSSAATTTTWRSRGWPPCCGGRVPCPGLARSLKDGGQ